MINTAQPCHEHGYQPQPYRFALNHSFLFSIAKYYHSRVCFTRAVVCIFYKLLLNATLPI